MAQTAVGEGSGFYVLNPLDWAVIELTTVGTGLYAQRESVSLYANGAIRVEWNTSGDDFERNLLRARCEGRFGFAVPRRLGVVKLDLTAA